MTDTTDTTDTTAPVHAYRKHAFIEWTDLAERLGMPGKPIKVWVEQDADYLHIVTEMDIPVGDEIPGGFFWYAPGNYTEASTLPSRVCDGDR